MNPSVQINIYGGGARARQPSSPPSAQLSRYAPPSAPVSPPAPAHSLLAALCFRSSGTCHPRSTPLSPGPLRQSLPARRSLSRTPLSPGTHRPPRRSLPPRRLSLSVPLSASALFRYAPPSLHAALSLPSAPFSPCVPPSKLLCA